MSDGQEGTGNTGRELWMSKKWVGKELCPCMASWAGGGELSTGLQEDLLQDRVSPVLSNMVFNHTLSHSTFEEKKKTNRCSFILFNVFQVYQWRQSSKKWPKLTFC